MKVLFMNKIIDGKTISDSIKLEIKNKVKDLKTKPKLVVIQVGNDSASNVYVKNKEKSALEVGFDFEHLKYDESIDENLLVSVIHELNQDTKVNGIIVQLPLPSSLNSKKIIDEINPIKDVDGLTNINLGKLINDEESLTPCTPNGIMYLLNEINVDLKGKNVVIVGRSNLVGKPLIHMLLKYDATVTICHSKTNNLDNFTKQADILIVAVGKKHLITSDMVKNDSIIIDVGINKIDDRLYGDVDFENVIDKVAYITPVPKGVGPMTVAMLLKNTLKSYNLMNKREQ